MVAKMILLKLFCIFGAVQGERHNLHYIYTALSKPINQPGLYQFSAMGILDERPIDFYNSDEKVKKPMQKWMETHNDKDYWEKGTQSRKSKEQWFDANVKILIQRKHDNETDSHILQWMHGCEVDITDGQPKYIKGYDQYGYDGEDFLAFDTSDSVWVAPVVEAEPTKKKWDGVPVLSQYTKGYLETECVHWLEKFVRYQKEEYETFAPPKVYIFSKKSSKPDARILVCLATGFYPPDVKVEILKNGMQLAEWDGVVSSGVRPNGDPKETYQLRKTLEIKASDNSKYSCRVRHRTLEKPIEEFWDGTCPSCECGSTVGTIAGIAVGVLLIALLAGAGVFVWKRKKAAEDGGQQPPQGNGVSAILLNTNGVQSEKGGSKDTLESDDSGHPRGNGHVTIPLTADEE